MTPEEEAALKEFQDKMAVGEPDKKPTVQNHTVEQFPEQTSLFDVATGTTSTESIASPKVEEVVEETAEDVLKKIQGHLKEHDGMESNIPLKHEYWGLLNLYRRLLAK